MITVPTLAVWGDHDRIVDPEGGRAYAAAIPGARFELMQSAGHLPQRETPKEFGRLLHDFIAGPVTSSADPRRTSR